MVNLVSLGASKVDDDSLLVESERQRDFRFSPSGEEESSTSFTQIFDLRVLMFEFRIAGFHMICRRHA